MSKVTNALTIGAASMFGGLFGTVVGAGLEHGKHKMHGASMAGLAIGSTVFAAAVSALIPSAPPAISSGTVSGLRFP